MNDDSTGAYDSHRESKNPKKKINSKEIFHHKKTKVGKKRSWNRIQISKKRSIVPTSMMLNVGGMATASEIEELQKREQRWLI